LSAGTNRCLVGDLNRNMQNTSELHNLIATALIGVIKLIKAIRYYPPRHPALQAAAADSQRGFEPILAAGDHLSLTVRKEGFLYDDFPVGKSSQVLVQLANFCFARRIQHLTFLADLKSSDLHHFVHYLLLDPQIIQKQGGMQAILERAHITTIWTNIRDLDEILHRRMEIEELPEDSDFDPAAVLIEGIDAAEGDTGSTDISTLVARLEQENDDARFHRSLQELIPLLRLNLNVGCRLLVLRALLLLCRCATGKECTPERKQSASQALSQLATDEMATYLVDYLFASGVDQKTRETLAKVISFLGSKIARRLMGMLADERMSVRRKALAEILVRCGSPVRTIICEYLDDERWYVVRNAVAILGDIRNQESLPQLTPLLQHDEIRVRRETIRALTKIGGQNATKILLQVAMHDDHEMRRQAILSLGAMRAASAVPTLLYLLKKSDWTQRGIDVKKDAIRALGEIRDPGSIPMLLRILGRKRWLRRKLNNELRVAAAAALGDIGEESTRKGLEKATHDRTAEVARAAAHALKQLNKANP
jgi:HEAT repeat protein